MKILWYNWRDIKNPDAGGAEVFTHEVCKRLIQKHGESITLFTSGFEGGKHEETVDGVKIVRSGNKYSVYKKAKEFYNQNKESFDLVVDEVNTKPFGTPSFVRNRPIVALIHQLAKEFWFYETPFPISLLGYYFLEKYWLRKYRNITTITVSNSTLQDLRDLGFTDVQVVPEGLSFLPPQVLPEKEVKPTVLFVGRLKKAKKPDDALRAFRKIKDEIPDARFWIVGSGYMEEELRSMARSWFPEDSSDITVFGNQATERKLELMSRAHVLLVPGVREGWGLVVTEANGMGTPAVAYDAPGLRDSVIDGVTGKLVLRGDYARMGIEVAQILKDKVMVKAYSEKALENARHFDWQITAARIREILQQCQLKQSRISREQIAS